MFAHQKLHVYQKLVVIAADLARLSADWDKRHSVVDQLARASESALLNLTEAVRLRSISAKQCTIDYAIGSALECAACLDISVVKELLSVTSGHGEKLRLCEVVKMLTGLRKSWNYEELREEPHQYAGEPTAPDSAALFAHERLIVYRTALDFVAWFHRLPGGRSLAHRLDRQVDKTATSMVLNIAEGNGRRGVADRLRFLNVAEVAAVKAATYLDLRQRQDGLDRQQAIAGLDRLEQITRLLRGFASGKRANERQA
jgi:four helix bundle protein